MTPRYTSLAQHPLTQQVLNTFYSGTAGRHYDTIHKPCYMDIPILNHRISNLTKEDERDIRDLASLLVRLHDVD